MSLTIGRLAREAGTKVETVRYYQRAGLLPVPNREAGCYRSYGPSDLTRLRFIRRARALGLPLASIAALLDLAERRDEPCEAVDRIVRTHRDDLAVRIADLVNLHHELDRLIERCDGDRVARCRILEALTPEPTRETERALAGRRAGISDPAAEPSEDRVSGSAIRPGSDRAPPRPTGKGR